MKLMDCYRVVTTVPTEGLEKLIDAVCDSGLLEYGNYGDVLWFSSVGTGQFRPLEGANPTIGGIGERERVQENRIEFSILRDESNLEKLIDIIINAHPYEEPAIHIMETKETRSG